MRDCLRRCGFWDEYYALRDRPVTWATWLPYSGWTNFITGALYVDTETINDPQMLFLVLTHEAQHIHDWFAWGRSPWYTHACPKRTDDEMTDAYIRYCVPHLPQRW